jgi:hypothetical protein
MSIKVETLQDFFGADVTKQTAQDVAALAKNGRRLFDDGIPQPLRNAAAGSVLAAGRSLLNSPFASLFGQAWSTARDLRAFCDTNAYPTDKVSDYTLVEHEIALERKPKVEVIIDEASTGIQVPFDLKLSVHLMSAVLKIQNGRIMSARVGDFRGAGIYTCLSVTVAERKTSTFRLPGAISFGEGVPIRTS